MNTQLRLWLIGDDEVLDVLAELSRHLDYFSVSRVDEPQDEIAAGDHIVVAYVDRARSPKILASLLAREPGFATVAPDEEEDSVGARAIQIAAELIAAIHDTR